MPKQALDCTLGEANDFGVILANISLPRVFPVLQGAARGFGGHLSHELHPSAAAFSSGHGSCPSHRPPGMTPVGSNWLDVAV